MKNLICPNCKNKRIVEDDCVISMCYCGSKMEEMEEENKDEERKKRR